MNLTHVHLLLNHIPTIGTAIAIGLLVLSVFRGHDLLHRVALEVVFVVALLTIPAYLSGVSAQQAQLHNPDIAEAFVDAHWTAALWAFLLMQISGAVAWLALWKFRRTGRMSRALFGAVLVISMLAFAASARAANLGGEIHHPEIMVAGATVEQEAPPSEASGLTAKGIGHWVTDQTFVWPASETLHFIGLWLIFGIILVVNLRLLGLMPSVPYSAVHRLLPWAALGFTVNVITGMLFVTATPDQYGENISFLWKIIFLVVAGFNLLYATVFEGPWHVEAGQKAPLRVRIAGASAIIAWGGVMYFGRMLPFLGNAF